MSGPQPLAAFPGDGVRIAVALANAHAAENAHKIGRATHRSHQLATGTIALFLFSLLVLGAAGWVSRSDRRTIERMAAEDALTGLPNQTAFAAHTRQALRDAQRTERRPTVLMVDLNGFKDDNDTLVHAVGAPRATTSRRPSTRRRSRAGSGTTPRSRFPR